MENKKIFLLLFIIVLLVIIGIQQYRLAEVKTSSRLLEKIEQLEGKIENLTKQKDSIRVVIDSTHVKIIDNEKHFQERVNTIIIRPDSISESFTRQYIRNFAASRGYIIIGSPETDN